MRIQQCGSTATGRGEDRLPARKRRHKIEEHSMKYASWGLLLSFSLLTSCAMLGLGQQGGLNLQAPEKERLHRELTGKEYVLASSVYSNTFFGNE